MQIVPVGTFLETLVDRLLSMLSLLEIEMRHTGDTEMKQQIIKISRKPGRA